MNKLLPLLCLLAATFSPLTAQDITTPIGMWQTIDAKTGEANSVIEIYEQDGKYFGRIAEILDGDKDALCTECSGKQKNQPLLGLVIIKNLRKDDDQWNGGTIMDPQRGADYRLSVWYDDNPNELFIRGKHWTGIYRTQTWIRK